ncbi:hypothetical protein [Gimesia panareensis]|uniref:Uncharacterized protein n=1 Tax=Gimesia panareensis TaxID=2527978 RepID=A0A518A017_9PLAN|nr:hypothetical protein [Gimesia panareensis]QDT25037.1 hypothetical protein Enr10x_03310 [Gimesia panareensis]QDU48031.1 hypothetical protein Pan110_03430 [Gimesia panareensis]
MTVDALIGMIDVTFDYFGALGDWHQDPEGLEAVRQIKEQMLQDLQEFEREPSDYELIELCRDWRALRMEPEGEATYPPDMFIESVCQVIEVS